MFLGKPIGRLNTTNVTTHKRYFSLKPLCCVIIIVPIVITTAINTINEIAAQIAKNISIPAIIAVLRTIFLLKSIILELAGDMA